MNPQDLFFMQEAYDLARSVGPQVLPNPRVGAVVVTKGQIVGKGRHRRFGGPHAEKYALKEAGPQARGGVLYCTLEPCSHYGKQPPCTQAIIEAGIKRVVVGSRDPNPKVKGIRELKRAGVDVTTNVMGQAVKSLNPGFYRAVETGLPYLHLKVATSVDGFMALPNGDSQWLTQMASRRRGHLLRGQAAAILTGIGTILKDDPELTVRHGPRRTPARLVLDSRLRISPTARIFKKKAGPVYLLTTIRRASPKKNKLERMGAQIQVVPADSRGYCQLQAVLEWCVSQGWLEIHVEAGPTLATQLIKEGYVSEISWFQGPLLLGEGLRLGPWGIDSIKEAHWIQGVKQEILGSDILWHGFLKTQSHR